MMTRLFVWHSMLQSVKPNGPNMCHFTDGSSKRRIFGRTERWKWGTILLILLILLLVGALPAWPHSRAWGYYPSGGLGLVLLIVVVLLLRGRI